LGSNKWNNRFVHRSRCVPQTIGNKGITDNQALFAVLLPSELSRVARVLGAAPAWPTLTHHGRIPIGVTGEN
jgi:hypothetical protein